MGRTLDQRSTFCPSADIPDGSRLAEREANECSSGSRRPGCHYAFAGARRTSLGVVEAQWILRIAVERASGRIQ